ncbi:hypothetical protein [Aurantiacibacter poecillastricola]|uniref:hypothetical protein n=1 Tax=Aurantiacibacter poecillastricola TaxID=3064385 RepID=UPI00273DE992|nr:hypothetical protein [Aurantiacibacter sp. 219JJ12-13]MDP5260217.1 hypothetical protein [Aurantiacibacter sp. 219JJ12-13]
MAQTFEFYSERADAAASAADEATLDNVRERELRAEKTWRGLAEQARKVSEDREKAARQKAAKREAEADEADTEAQAEG